MKRVDFEVGWNYGPKKCPEKKQWHTELKFHTEVAINLVCVATCALVNESQVCFCHTACVLIHWLIDRLLDRLIGWLVKIFVWFFSAGKKGRSSDLQHRPTEANWNEDPHRGVYLYKARNPVHADIWVRFLDKESGKILAWEKTSRKNCPPLVFLQLRQLGDCPKLRQHAEGMHQIRVAGQDHPFLAGVLSVFSVRGRIRVRHRFRRLFFLQGLFVKIWSWNFSGQCFLPSVFLGPSFEAQNYRRGLSQQQLRQIFPALPAPPRFRQLRHPAAVLEGKRPTTARCRVPSITFLFHFHHQSGFFFTQLLGELLLDRHNFNVMTKYIGNPENLKLMMIMLREKSRNIQFEAFHVFKVCTLSLSLIFCPSILFDGRIFLPTITWSACSNFFVNPMSHLHMINFISIFQHEKREKKEKKREKKWKMARRNDGKGMLMILENVSVTFQKKNFFITSFLS